MLQTDAAYGTLYFRIINKRKRATIYLEKIHEILV